MKAFSSGFSLLELLLAIAIVAILSGLSLPSYIAYLNRSAFGACHQELSTFKQQVMATNELNYSIESFSFAACSVGGEGQPAQREVADAFFGVFGGELSSLILDTQRDGVQARIMANGSIERVVTP